MLDAVREAGSPIRTRMRYTVILISLMRYQEVITVEQILIRNLPVGTKSALRARAERHHRSVEAEVRDVLAEALRRDPLTIVDLLSTDEGAEIEFEPQRLGLTARAAEL